MSQYTDGPTKTFTSGGALGQFLRVDTPAALALAGASDVEIGTVEEAVFAAGPTTVRLTTAQGTIKMVAGGVIAIGGTVYAAASGKVAATGTVVIGYAMEATTADGDILEVLRVANTDISTAISGTTAAAFVADSDATTAKVAIGTGAGTGDYTATIVAPTLAANRTIILPAVAGTLATLAGAETMTNKTMTAPVLTSPVLSLAVATVVTGGTAIGNANAVAASTFTLVTGADNTAAAKLPEAAAGAICIVKNISGTAILPVFPAVNDSINNAAANAVYNMGNNGLNIFVAYNAVAWSTDLAKA